MAVRIRMKKMGRTHRPFFRLCAMDSRSPRNGRVIEELGYYDPMIKEVDARVVLKAERVDYWLSVGAKPTPKVGTLIKKYGTGGTHLESQAEALQRLAASKPSAPEPVVIKVKAPEPEPKPEGETPADEASPEGEAAAEAEAAAEKPAEEKTEE